MKELRVPLCAGGGGGGSIGVSSLASFYQSISLVSFSKPSTQHAEDMVAVVAVAGSENGQLIQQVSIF
jgi:hypothetical protein